MNAEQLKRMHEDAGFVAALDQSGGSTPKALRQYGIPENEYEGEEQMYDMVHAMRTRIMTSPSFDGRYILGAILFENTMRREVEGEPTADYLWNRKRIVSFLKVDKGLAEPLRGVQLMRQITGLDALLREARDRNIFGTKMRSVIKSADRAGIAEAVAQQFEVGQKIVDAGLVPILEPEVDITSPDRGESEAIMKEEIGKHLAAMDPKARIMFKFSIPVVDNLYADLMADPRVVRVVALSGGFSRADACERLARNKGLIASFSRALAEGLSAGQDKAAFDKTLADAVALIYKASAT